MHALALLLTMSVLLYFRGVRLYVAFLVLMTVMLKALGPTGFLGRVLIQATHAKETNLMQGKARATRFGCSKQGASNAAMRWIRPFPPGCGKTRRLLRCRA